LNQLQTDLFTAESAGEKENPKEISADNPKQKIPPFGGFFVFPQKKTALSSRK